MNPLPDAVLLAEFRLAQMTDAEVYALFTEPHKKSPRDFSRGLHAGNGGGLQKDAQNLGLRRYGAAWRKFPPTARGRGGSDRAFGRRACS
jgi:hypothetical protein